MSEIEFSLCRAQDEGGWWIQGFPLVVGANRMILIESAGEPVAGLAGKAALPVVCHDVRPETLCRYSGFYDRSGRKIFQKDILLCELPDGDFVHHYLVLVDLFEGLWIGLHEGCCLENACRSDMDLSYVADESVVIGNGFDNKAWLNIWSTTHEDT